MKSVLIKYLFILFPFTINAQQLWTGGTTRFKLNPSLSAEVEYQFRTQDRFDHYESQFAELSMRYKFTQHIGVKSGFRYKDEIGFNEARVYADVFGVIGSTNTKIVNNIRGRFQRNVKTGKSPADDLRVKYTCQYNLSKYAQPFIELELFYGLEIRNFNERRLTYGIQTELTEKLVLTTFFRRKTEFNLEKPDKAHILGVMLLWNVDLRKNTEKDNDNFERY